MPVMWLIPTANRVQPTKGMYLCPVYKTLTRAGVCGGGGCDPLGFYDQWMQLLHVQSCTL